MGFVQRSQGNLVYYVAEAFENTGIVRHCFTTRIGGKSGGHLSSLNLGLWKEDDKEAVLNNYKTVCDAIGIKIDNLVLSDQIHGDEIRRVGKRDIGKGIFLESDIIDVDGLMTDEREVGLVTFYADCVPVFFLDIENKAIAISHAGWKGTQQRIAQKTLLRMNQSFGTKVENCIVAIGPSIGQCCFEVGYDVVEKFDKNFSNLKEFCKQKSSEKWLIDLKLCNAMQLMEIGIPQANITVSQECTCCMKDTFFSHRGDKGRTGSLCGIIQLI